MDMDENMDMDKDMNHWHEHAALIRICRIDMDMNKQGRHGHTA
jgi:hypothetical protein